MASAPTSARVRAIIFLHCLDPPSTKVRKLGRPYCDTGQAYPREGCAPSLARNGPRFARVPQFAPRAGAAVIPPNERGARGGVSASAPVIAYVINARTGQETPGGRSVQRVEN